MLWIVARILFFVALVAALGLGGAVLVETGGSLRIALAVQRA